MKKHILIAYTNTGAGHKTPAEAVAQALEERYPGQYRISLSDFFAEAGADDFNRFICTGWDWLLAHPKINFCNIMLSHILSPGIHWFLPLLYRKAWKGGMAYLDKVKPDLVFTTHFYCQNVAIDARPRYGLSYPVVTLNPDSFETFPLWDRRGDFFMVNSSMAYDKALQQGHKAERTLVVPQALRKAFDKKPKQIDKKNMRARLDLPRDRLTLFLSDGGQGIGVMKAVLETLIASGLPLNALCICGRNKNLYQELNALAQNSGSVAMKVYGYVDNMAELLSAADLFVGKGGPASVIEALKMDLPALITYAVNTAETNTRSFFVGQGMAWYARKPAQTPALIKTFLEDPALLQRAVERIRSSPFFDNGSPLIAEIISDIAEDPSRISKYIPKR